LEYAARKGTAWKRKLLGVTVETESHDGAAAGLTSNGGRSNSVPMVGAEGTHGKGHQVQLDLKIKSAGPADFEARMN
jgi:hypothetical protein